MARGRFYDAQRKEEWRGIAWKGPGREPEIDVNRISRLPDRPCFRCNSRGFCAHWSEL